MLERVLVSGLLPEVNDAGRAGEDLGNEVVADALDDVGVAGGGGVQRLGECENAAFLEEGCGLESG